jgi:hypothetical protein
MLACCRQRFVADRRMHGAAPILVEHASAIASGDDAGNLRRLIEHRQQPRTIRHDPAIRDGTRHGRFDIALEGDWPARRAADARVATRICDVVRKPERHDEGTC